MKQTFVSEVLEIDNPLAKQPKGKATKEMIASAKDTDTENSGTECKSINPETDDWESMFDNNGDCLDPKLLIELTASVGQVTIETPKSDYKVTFSLAFEFCRYYDLYPISSYTIRNRPY